MDRCGWMSADGTNPTWSVVDVCYHTWHKRRLLLQIAFWMTVPHWVGGQGQVGGSTKPRGHRTHITCAKAMVRGQALVRIARLVAPDTPAVAASGVNRDQRRDRDAAANAQFTEKGVMFVIVAVDG